MYMHIEFVNGSKIVEFCHEGRHYVKDGVLVVTTNANTGEWVSYPLTNVLKYQIKRDRA